MIGIAQVSKTQAVLDCLKTQDLMIIFLSMCMGLSAPWYKVHNFIPPVPELHGAVVASCVEHRLVHLHASIVQHLGKLPGLPNVYCVLHGITSKSVHVDGELLVLLDLHIRVNWCRRVGLVLLLDIEAHLLRDLVLLQQLYACQHWSCHCHLLLLLVHPRDVPEEFHEHLGLRPVLPVPLLALVLLESLQGGHCLVLLHIVHLRLTEVLLPLIGQLCASPFHTWILPHLVPVKLFESGVRNFLSATIIVIIRLVPTSKGAEKVFDSLKLRSGQGRAS